MCKVEKFHELYEVCKKLNLMVNIVKELREAGMSDAWMVKHLGMDAEELLRLKQISGLAAMFENNQFSESKEE